MILRMTKPRRIERKMKRGKRDSEYPTLVSVFSLPQVHRSFPGIGEEQAQGRQRV